MSFSVYSYLVANLREIVRKFDPQLFIERHVLAPDPPTKADMYNVYAVRGGAASWHDVLRVNECKTVESSALLTFSDWLTRADPFRLHSIRLFDKPTRGRASAKSGKDRGHHRVPP